jgi:hypothetical protein
MKQVLDAGDAVIYIPTSGVSSIAETVGRCLKSKFFEFAFERENKVRPFFYVVDAVTGSQSAPPYTSFLASWPAPLVDGLARTDPF